MPDRRSFNALQLRLSRELYRTALAKSDREIRIHEIWIAQIKREIASEMARIGLSATVDDCTMTDEELRATMGE